MPTASQTLREFARKNFGDMGLEGPSKELTSRGFELTHEYCWKRRRPPNDFEWNCIYFLIEEWDYNGYTED